MPTISLQTVLHALAHDRPWNALIDLNYLLGHMQVVPSDLFVVRSQLLARLGQAAASAADNERAVQGKGILPDPVQAPVASAISLQPQIAQAELTVLIPVHNGGSVIRRCLESVSRALAAGMQVLVVDDGSDDAPTLTVLDQYAALPGFQVFRHAGPSGFVAAVNAGLEILPPGHVLLLNSDTYVPKDTLRTLLGHLRQTPDLATITPFSNHGGSFTLPLPRHHYAMPTPSQCEAIAKAARTLNQGMLCDVLSGNGFAMAITAHCRQSLPTLSPAFGSGYYEEVDYCLRARALGLRNVCATDCFIGHLGSLSFGQGKRRLANDNLVLLEALHPGFGAEFDRFARFDPLRRFRLAIMDKVAWNPQKVENDDMPTMQTVELPASLQWRGAQRFVVPTTGPIDGDRLDGSTHSIRWIKAEHLMAHGLQLMPPHNLRSAFIVHGDRAKLALLAGEELITSIDLPISGPDRQDNQMPQIEAAALQILESRYGPV